MIEREPMPIGSRPFMAASTCLDVGDLDARRGGDLRIGLGQEAVRVEGADDVVGHRVEARAAGARGGSRSGGPRG